MRRIVALTLSLFLTLSFLPMAQSSSLDSWASFGGGFEADNLAGHVVLDDGSIIVGGTFSTSISFDEIGVEATNRAGDVDMYIAMAKPNGTWTSVYGFGSNGTDGLSSIALHPSGDIILVGEFCQNTAGIECEMNFTSSFTLPKANDTDDGGLFVARLTYIGDTISPIWVRQISNEFRTEGFDLAVSSDGGTISIGLFFQQELFIEDLFLVGSESNSLGIVSYDQNGNLLWVNQINSPLGIEPFGGMCFSDTGSLHVVGTFLDTVEIVDSQISTGGSDIFVAQLDNTGNYSWKSFAGSTGDDWVNDLSLIHI